MASKKLLSFNFPNAESNHWLRKVHSCARNEGWEVVWCDFAGDALFPIEDIARREFTYMTLEDRRFNSAPRMTIEQYQTCCGDDIDFLKIAIHHHYCLGLPIDEGHLSPESMHRQRLRGLAFRIEQLLTQVQPDAVLAPHGADVMSKLVMAKCLKQQIPIALRESPFFADYCLIDTLGMHFFPGESEIDDAWPERSATPLQPAEQQLVTEFVTRWKRTKSSKYEQSPGADLQAVLDAKKSGKTIVFLPGQLANDASVLYGLGQFGSLHEFESELQAQLPADFVLIRKSHPNDTSQTIVSSDKVISVDGHSIHELIELSDVVAPFSSNVGLESLLYDKPVVCGGQPHYSGKGITVDISHRHEIASALVTAKEQGVDVVQRDRYLQYLLTDYLFHQTDSAGFTRKMLQAGRLVDRTDARAPLCRCHNAEVQQYLAFAKDYEKWYYDNLVHDEIVQRCEVAPPQRSQHVAAIKGAELKSGERQFGTDYTGIEMGHLARYAFASQIAKAKKCRILDIACGVGYGSFMLANESEANVIGVDASPDAIAHAREHWSNDRTEYVQASAGTFFDKPIGCVDMITCLETLEHLPNPEGFLRKCWDALNPNGIMVVSVPHADVFPLLDTQFHVQHHSAGSLQELFATVSPVYQRVLGQHRERIVASEKGARFLLGVFAKTDASQMVDRLLPYEMGGLLPKPVAVEAEIELEMEVIAVAESERRRSAGRRLERWIRTKIPARVRHPLRHRRNRAA